MIQIEEEALHRIDSALRDLNAADIPGMTELEREFAEMDEIVLAMRKTVAASEELARAGGRCGTARARS